MIKKTRSERKDSARKNQRSLTSNLEDPITLIAQSQVIDSVSLLDFRKSSAYF
jgi:hypothetical protein